MSSKQHTNLIDALAADLVPVQRLYSPGLRAAFWLAVVAALALGLYLAYDITNLLIRIEHVPETKIAVAAAVATAVLGAIAVFQLSLPDRSPRWGYLPVPALVFWLGASGLGTFNRLEALPEMRWYTILEAPDCLIYVVALSIPLSTLLIFMLRRGYTLYPGLTSVAGGIAVAAASTALLEIFHPFDAAGTDILVHALAIGLVIGVNRWLGATFLQKK